MRAVRRGCSAVVSHHPVIFLPLKALVPGTAPYLLARHGIAAVCAHTNLDKAPGGVGDALATALGLSGIEPCGSYCRRGTLPHEMTPRGFAAHVQAALGVPVRLVDAGAPVRTVGVVSGAGDELWAEAKAAACDAFVHWGNGPPSCVGCAGGGAHLCGGHPPRHRACDCAGACRAPSRRIPRPGRAGERNGYRALLHAGKPLCSAARQAAPGPQPARNEKSAAFAP